MHGGSHWIARALFEIGDVLVEQWLNLRWLNIRLGRHETKERQQKRWSRNDSNGSLHAFFAGTVWQPKWRKETGLSLIVPSHRKFDILNISRDYFGNARSSRRDTLWQFSFEFPAQFDTTFAMAGGTVPKLRNIVYMHVGPKMASKCDFVYTINANLFFSLSSYKYAYFHSQLLKLISFWYIVLQKVSATNFGEKKTTKTKGQKNKEIHKKFTKQ